MLETYSKQQLQTLVGYEVKDSAGEKVGYVDDQTGQPEWIGNGLPSGHRYLAPLQGMTHEGDSVRVPWTKEQIQSAPTDDELDTAASSSVRAITSRSPGSRRKRLTATTGSNRPASAQTGTPGSASGSTKSGPSASGSKARPGAALGFVV